MAMAIGPVATGASFLTVGWHALDRLIVNIIDGTLHKRHSLGVSQAVGRPQLIGS